MTPTPCAVITGGDGRLAAAVAPGFAELGWEVFSFGRSMLDVTDRESVFDCVTATGADVVVNLAAWTDVQGCENEPERARAVNTGAVGHLRDATAAVGAHLVHVSSDHVFDGRATKPYAEGDHANPMNVYGATKLASESEAGSLTTVVRTSWISGRHRRCLVRSALAAAVDPDCRPRFIDDRFGSPTVASDLVKVLDYVARARIGGLWHAAGTGVTTPYGIAHHVFTELGIDTKRIARISSIDRLTAQSARRPAYAALDSTALEALGAPVPGDWHDSVSRLITEVEHEHSR